jgi:phenylpropionate dioxygenase-like ring-hydroxylating dioxygenase large terminal subunit
MTEYVRNCWYAAAWNHEISETPLARTLLDEPVVLYRTEDGTPVALEDRCCHRSLPLSMGRLVGDDLQCGYHGLRFAPDGSCIEVPGQSLVPPGAAIRSYPVVERNQWIWIWMGDAADADPALLPDWWWMDHPDWAVVKGDPPFYIPCDYRLVTDNLLDLLHVAYVHESSIGTDAVADFPITVDRDEDMVRMTRWVLDSPPAPLYKRLGGFTGNVDRWQISEAHVPTHIDVYVGSAVAGTGAQEGNRDHGIEFHNLNTMTPETATTTHYFYAHARSFAIGDAEVDQTYAQGFRAVFQEDVDILGAQQANLDRHPGASYIDINTDGPGLTLRRMIDQRIAAERGRTAA